MRGLVRKSLYYLAIAYSSGVLFTHSPVALSQPGTNPNFSVTVNTGPIPPNSNTVYPGELTSIRITLANNSTLASIENTAFNKPLPTSATGGLVISGSGTLSGAGCTGGVLSTADGQPGVTLGGLTIPARIDGVPGSGECYIDLPVVAWSSDGAATSHSYSLEAGEVSSDSGSNASGGPQAITVRPVSRPTWSKSFSGAPLVLGGDPGILTIRINNPDSHVALSDFSFTDIFPSAGPGGALFEPTGTPATGSCVTAPVNAQVTLQPGPAAQVAVSAGTLPASGSCTVQVEVQARHTNDAFRQNTTNVIDADSFDSREGVRPAADANARVQVRSPLSVTKNFSENPVASGVPSSFTIRLGNSGNTPLPVNRFADNPVSAAPHEGRLTVTSITNSCGGSSTLLNGGNGFEVGGFTIPANGNCTLDVSFTGQTPGANTPTTYRNVIPQGAVELDGIPGIVSQTRTATVIVADRLRVLKSRSPATAAPGSAVQYSVTIQNYSNDVLPNVTVADQLQNGSTLLLDATHPVELVPASCGTPGLNGREAGDDDLLFTIPSIAARASASSPGQCTLSFWVMMDPDGDGNTTNQIDTCAVRIDGSPSDCNATPSNQTSVNHVSVMALSKQFDGVETSTMREGMRSRLNLRLSNYSDQELTSVAVSDTFPIDGPLAQLRIANPANAATNCGGSLVTVPGTTSLDLNGGTVPGRDESSGEPGSCEIQVDVVGPAGTYDNTASVLAVQNNADGSTTQAQANDGARLIYTGVLTAAKSFSPASTGQGGRSTVRVALNNSDPVRTLSGLTVTDPLPTGMQVASPSGAYSSCGNNAIISASPGATEVTLQNGIIPPGGTCDLVFDVIVDGDADWTNIITSGGIRADGGIVNQDPVSATLSYVPPEDPIIAKSITPGLIAPGQLARLTITVTNGNSPLTDVAVSDYFTEDGLANGSPNGMRVASPAQLSTSCRAGVVVAQPGDTSVHLTGAELDPRETCQVEVNVTSSTVGTITNYIPLGALTSAEGATNNTTFAQSTLSTTSSVNVVKTFEPRVVSPGETSRLRLTIFNSLPTPLRNFGIQDNLPTGLQVAEEANAYSNCGGAVNLTWPDQTSVVLSGGRLAEAVDGNASSCHLEVDVVAADEGTYTNLIPEDSLTEAGTPLEHPETEDSLEVRERLIVNKAIDDHTLDDGDPAGFTTGDAVRLAGVPAPLTIRIENPTSASLTQVRFTDTLPEGMVVAAQPNAQTDCADATVISAPAAREIRMTGAALAARGAAGAICSVTVNVVSNEHGVYVNQVDAGEVTSFEGITNEEPTQARLVISEAPAVSKVFEPPVARPNGSSRLTINIANPNAAATTLTADLVDALPSLPAQMVVATPPNIATTCPEGNAIVQAAAGADSVVIRSGSEVPPVGCEVSVDVAAPLAGTYRNRIPANTLETTFGVNADPASSDLQVSTRGYISGKVFIDLQNNPDGNYVSGEAEPVAGNPIELHHGNSCSDPAPMTVTTDSQGNYLFTDLPAGTYSVCQPVQPPGSYNSHTSPGTIDTVNGSGGTPGTGSNPGSGGYTSQIIGIVLNDSGSSDEVSGSPGNNFSELPPATISGHVYHDSNNNGIREAGEPGIEGVEITLTGPLTVTVTTDSEGFYSVEGLPPGEYTVTEAQPAGWDDGLDSVGTHGGNLENDRISAIVLVAGDRAENYDFGEILPDNPAPPAQDWTATATCVNDAPAVEYQVTGASGSTVSLWWITEGGRLAERVENLPANGSVLWPGVTTNVDNEPVSWPGWLQVGDELVEVPDDRIPTMVLRLNGDGATEIVLDYPACASQPRRATHAIPTTPPWVLMLLALSIAGIAGMRLQQRSAGV